ncbi:MAG: hypothetical protein R3Y36_01260 [Spirochaetales bacterium]
MKNKILIALFTICIITTLISCSKRSDYVQKAWRLADTIDYEDMNTVENDIQAVIDLFDSIMGISKNFSF